MKKALKKNIAIGFLLGLFFLWSQPLIARATITSDNSIDCPAVPATEILIYFHGLLYPEHTQNGSNWTLEESINTFYSELNKIRSSRPGVAAAHYRYGTSASTVINAVKTQCGINSQVTVTLAGHSAGGQSLKNAGNLADKIILLDAIYWDPSPLFNYCAKIRVVDGSSTQTNTPTLVNQCQSETKFKYVNYNDIGNPGHFAIRSYLSTFYLDTGANTPGTTNSQSTSTVESKPVDLTNPLMNLQVKIPGIAKVVADNPASCRMVDDHTECTIPWIAQYIKGIYNYALAIVGILAAITLMIGGVIWLTSAGNATRVSQAKNWIAGSLTGLLIMMTSYILLNELNPDLIGLKPITIKTVEEVTGYEGAGTDLPGESISGDCDVTYESIKGLANTTCSASICALAPEAAKKLRELSIAAQKKGITLAISSAARSVSTQQKLWDGCMASHGNDEAACRKLVAKPNCRSPHLAGVAIDLCIAGTESCNHLGAKNDANAKYRDCGTAKLEKFMKEENGWTRYCGEWWHFEYTALGFPSRANPGQTCPGPAQPTNCP